jgi:hypothetical protein
MNMPRKIALFIAEIRCRPEFIAGVAADPKKEDELADIQKGLEVVYRDAGLVEAFDRIEAILDRPGLPIKQRLTAIGKIMTEVRDAGRSVN